MASFSVLIGSAANDPSTVTASGSAVSVASSKEMQNVRKDITPSSLEHLSITVDGKDMSLYDPMELSGWATCLKEGATVSVKVSGDSNNNNNDILQPIHTSFLLAGLKGASERREADGSRVLTATRTTTSTNAVKPVKLPVPTTTKKEKVSISLDGGLDADDDLIDEDGLLDAGDALLAPPPAMSEAATTTDDCGGRKACDNCTCGRAEQEAADAKPKEAPKSSCGKCGLGDAFRCASCPYLGKPAFKPGEEHLVLDLKDDL